MRRWAPTRQFLGATLGVSSPHEAPPPPPPPPPRPAPEPIIPSPTDFARSLGFSPDPDQQQILNAIIPRGILNCSRQWGKSTITALKAVHRAIYHPESLVLVISPSGRQSATFLEKARSFVVKLGQKPKGDGHNDISIAFPNGSKIVGLPSVEGTIRGFSSVSLLIIDEASRVDDKIYHAVRPMMAASAATKSHPAFPATPECWLISTPHGCRGFFYDEWNRHQADPPWTRFSILASDCSRIDPKWLAEEQSIMPAPLFRQEYCCEFVKDGENNSFFPWRDLEAAYDDNVSPLFDKPHNYTVWARTGGYL